MRAWLVLALAFVFFAAGPASASDRERSVSEMMSDLRRIQERMAEGDKIAYASQQEKLKSIALTIAGARPETWKDKAETDAVAAYVLSGGQPRVIARLLEGGVIPASEDPLLRGALAYTVGREREAEALLGDIDPRKVSLRLAGQLAYAQSVLKTARAPDQAIALLDLARLLAPGGLVEEAALRREILLVGDKRDSERVVFLARQYVMRFGHSIYAENFIQGLGEETVRYGLGDDIAGLNRFEALLALVSPQQRRMFLLVVARAQTLNGRFDVAEAAARSASRESTPGTPEAATAEMLAAAARVVGPDYEEGARALARVDKAKLPRADQDLFSAIAYTADHLRDMPSEAALLEAGREERIAAVRSPRAMADGQRDEINQTIARAEAILARSESVGRGLTP